MNFGLLQTHPHLPVKQVEHPNDTILLLRLFDTDVSALGWMFQKVQSLRRTSNIWYSGGNITKKRDLLSSSHARRLTHVHKYTVRNWNRRTNSTDINPPKSDLACLQHLTFTRLPSSTTLLPLIPHTSSQSRHLHPHILHTPLPPFWAQLRNPTTNNSIVCSAPLDLPATNNQTSCDPKFKSLIPIFYVPYKIIDPVSLLFEYFMYFLL